MKKLISFMAIFAAMAMTMAFVSCGGDDDDTDSAANRLAFANKLTQNGLSCTWEGLSMQQRKEMGSWNDERQMYAVMRFDRTATSETQGTGILLFFENSYKESFIEGSEFTWTFSDDMLRLSYRRGGWKAQYAEYRTSELVINGNTFNGTLFESTDFKYRFNFTKSTFTDWAKYIN